MGLIPFCKIQAKVPKRTKQPTAVGPRANVASPRIGSLTYEGADGAEQYKAMELLLVTLQNRGGNAGKLT